MGPDFVQTAGQADPDTADGHPVFFREFLVGKVMDKEVAQQLGLARFQTGEGGVEEPGEIAQIGGAEVAGQLFGAPT